MLAFAAHGGSRASAESTGAAADPFEWLESVASPRATAWVQAENTKTLDVLKNDPFFAPAYADAVAVGEANDRIPYPEVIGGRIYNFWQDAEHVRGIWRRTSVADYANATPAWETVLDLDALAKDEGKNWIFHGADCDSPSERRCLIVLSDGGEDASTIREFDLVSKSFVRDGFVLPHGKQNVAWDTADSLLVSREWAPGELTASGYPYIVKRLARGKELASAVEIARGTPSDVSADPFAVLDGAGNRIVGIRRNTSFFEHQTSLVTASGVRRFAIPLKANLAGLVAGRLLVKTNETWHVAGRTFPAGALVALDAARTLASPAQLVPQLVYAAPARATLDEIATTRDRIVISTLENVRGRAYVLTPASGGSWTQTALPLPDNSTIAPVAADRHSDLAYLSTTSFLTPTTLVRADLASATVTKVKALAPKFDASGDIVEQFEATSRDGTQIPYFVVRPKAIPFDGSTPTVMYAYGGFQVSETPNYSGTLGKLWLEHGGAYVLANIRGGGEFGPAWHEAGLKTNRQRIYDDFAAVARDLTARKITSPHELGISGGSNGGLLMGVELTQHPELWSAVDIAVPLLDMLRFEKIAAGASWVGEYGSISVPAERAFLASISPYNNLRAGVAYPEPLIWTTTKDDRVGPQHARKFAAKLAALGDPYLFYEVTEGGHGAGANIRERAFTSALEYTYFTQRLVEKRAASTH